MPRAAAGQRCSDRDCDTDDFGNFVPAEVSHPNRCYAHLTTLQIVTAFIHSPQNEWLTKDIRKIPFEEWADKYPKNIRERLYEAKTVYDARQLVDSDARTKCFVKMETSAKQTDPRNITTRRMEWNVACGPQISSIEHAARESPYLVKGLSPDQRAAKVERVREFGFVLEKDYNRFDKTICYDYQRVVEHRILRHPFIDDLPFAAALKAALIMAGITAHGIRYWRKGSRGSGDRQTSIGNGLDNAFNTFMSLCRFPIDSWFGFHEGDDGMIGVRLGYEEFAMSALTVLQAWGFSIKLRMTPTVQEAGFCGRLFVDGLQMGDLADIRRALVKFHVTCSQGSVKNLLLAKAMSYWVMSKDQPILAWLCYAIIKLLRPTISGKSQNRALDRMKKTIYAVRDMSNSEIFEAINTMTEPVVCAEKRGAAAYHGIGLDKQFQMEEEYRTWLVIGHIPERIFHPLESYDEIQAARVFPHIAQ